jgi:hypothetical protein
VKRREKERGEDIRGELFCAKKFPPDPLQKTPCNVRVKLVAVVRRDQVL